MSDPAQDQSTAVATSVTEENAIDHASVPTPHQPTLAALTDLIDPERNIYSPPLTPENESKIAELQNAVLNDASITTELADADIKLWLNPINYYRFLRARQYDVAKAKHLLVSTIQWRRKAKPNRLRADNPDVEKESVFGKILVRDYDQYGRPIMVMNNDKNKSKNAAEHQLNFVYFNLERTKQRMEQAHAAALAANPPPTRTITTPNGTNVTLLPSKMIEKYVLFIHLENHSFFTAPPLKTSMETAKALTERYPESMGHCILWQPPAVFSLLWKAVSPFLDHRTVRKIFFLRGEYTEGSNNDLIMKEIVGENWRHLCQVDESVEERYDHKADWGKITEEQKEYWNMQGWDW